MSRADLGLGHTELKPAVWITEYSPELRKELITHDIVIPSLLTVYDWPGFYDQPRDVQRQMAEFDMAHHRYWNTSEMRTGKTAGVLWATDAQMRWEGLQKVLILAPKSALIRTWKKEIFSIMPQVATYYSEGSSTKPLKQALESNKYRIMVINYDKFWRCATEIIKWGPGKIIADEASECNDRTTKRARNLRLIFKGRDYIRFAAMTGTPLPNRPTDVWSLSRFINPDTPSSYASFENSIMYPAYPGSRKLLAQPWAKEVVAKLMVPKISFSTEDVPGIPEHETIEIPVEMSPAQSKAFKDLKREFYTETVGKEITTQDAGARLWKLVQVSAGSAIADDGTPMIVGAPEKIAETQRIIRESSGKTLIFARYIAVQDYIMSKLKGEFNIKLINGQTSEKNELEWSEGFQTGDVDVLLLNPDKFKYSVQLDAGSSCVWFHPVHSSLVYSQASARVRGTAQGVMGKTTAFNLSCNSFESTIYETVLQRMADQDDVKAGNVGHQFDELELFKKLILENPE